MRRAATIAFVLFTMLSPAQTRAQHPSTAEACKERLPTDRMTIELRGADVQTTLRLLAEQYRISLIVTPDVTGLVTVSLYDVPARDAFAALIRAAGLGCVERDAILTVMPGERLLKETETARKEQEESRKAEQAAREQQRQRQDESRKAEQGTREQPASPAMSVKGIVRLPGAVLAIVNDQIVKVGDVVDGQQVEGIGDEGVVFREPGRLPRSVPLSGVGAAAGTKK